MTPTYTKRTSFAVTPLSPYVKDENSLIIQDQIVSIQYHELKEFLFNKFDDIIYKDMYFKNENGNIVIENQSANDVKEKNENESIKDNLKKIENDIKDVKNIEGNEKNIQIEKKQKAPKTNESVPVNKNIQTKKDTKTDPKNKNLQSEKKQNKPDKNISEKKKSNIDPKNPTKTKHIPEKTKNKAQKDKNNNKNKPEKEFCEETQQFYHKPTKNNIFEKKSKSELTVPSFNKNLVYDKKNISLPNSPNLPKTPEKQKSCPPTARDHEGVKETLNVHPTHQHPNCYRQNYKSSCFCTYNKNNKKTNRYACCCYDKLKQSFEKEHSENKNNLSAR